MPTDAQVKQCLEEMAIQLGLKGHLLIYMDDNHKVKIAGEMNLIALAPIIAELILKKVAR